MARASARTPSENAYRGAVGRTQTATVHVTDARGDLTAATVYTSIDAVSDRELAQRLQDGERTFNTGRVGDETVAIAVPVVYHDPAAELLVLVLAEAHRHRELDERIRLLERLRDDGAAVPRYAKEFAVVFGAAGLRAYLEARAEQAMAARAHDKEREQAQRRAQSASSEPRAVTPAEPRAVIPEPAASAREHAVLVSRALLPAEPSAPRVAAPVVAAPTPPAPAAPAHDDSHTVPIDLAEASDVEISADVHAALTRSNDPATNGAHAHADGSGPVAAPTRLSTDHDHDHEPTGQTVIPPGADALITDTTELPASAGDPWLDFAATGVTPTFHVDNGRVRVALIAGEQLARGLGGLLDVRVLLHRVTNYAVVTLLVGPPAAMRAPTISQLAVMPLDVSNDLDRAVLVALSERCDLTIDIVVRARPIRRVRVQAPLADNVTYILHAADDHLRALSADGEVEMSFVRARDQVLGAAYDLLGVQDAEYGEFREDKLGQLGTAQHVRRALAITRRFARPSREDYLVCARGFSLTRWHELRRHVLETAVGWGIWMGPELAQVAVADGMARSRRELVSRLDAGFDLLRHDAHAFDLDADAADDNWKALVEEARAQGVDLKKHTNGAIKSEDLPTVSGSIERTPTAGLPRGKSIEELLALLDDRGARVAAAAELCDRGDPRGAAPVISAVKKMSRAEAVRILGKSVKFGSAAAKPLIDGLGSSKAFLRHGCALALSLLREEDGAHAVIELLVNEPTEIWREIARAIGQIGPTALMPLASHVGRMLPMPATVGERVAWAMAHIGVRGGKASLEQMAGGASVMAPLAKQALELLENAARDELRVRPGSDARDVTVNHAFSRRFFEALEQDRPDVARGAMQDFEASRPQELQDADLIVDDDDTELDESDLIQS